MWVVLSILLVTIASHSYWGEDSGVDKGLYVEVRRGDRGFNPSAIIPPVES